jgi:hypothetical protein
MTLKGNIKILKINFKSYKSYWQTFKLRIGAFGKSIIPKMSLKEKLII